MLMANNAIIQAAVIFCMIRLLNNVLFFATMLQI